MSSPPAERLLKGTCAARGLAVGRIGVVVEPDRNSYHAGPPDDETEALDAAVGAALEQLGDLIGTAGDEAGEILAFQAALLEDEALIEPAREAIAAGSSAPDAWDAAMQVHVDEYRAAEDDYFRARAEDLTDLKDRVLRNLLGAGEQQVAVEVGAGPVLLALREMTPSRFVATDWQRVAGLALAGGSATGHVAILARSRGVPLLTGLGEALQEAAGGAPAILDAEQGVLVLHPAADRLAAAKRRIDARAAAAAAEARYLDRPACTGTGEPVTVMINVDDPQSPPPVPAAHCDGVGLTRSEFLFYGHGGLPEEETQFQCYRRLLEWADGRPVTVRTLDAGGDKPIPGLTPDGEANPFLGLRGLRLSLQRKPVFLVQLRALARAAALGPLKVMAPMVTAPWELAECRALLAEAVEGLRAAGQAAAMPPLGMMVEVPAAALSASAFDADFYSIGSNDLIQYVMAAGRDIDSVARLYDPMDPAVAELIGRVVKAGAERGVEVSLCGDMASEPDQVRHLLGLGVRGLSVAPARLASVKAAIAAVGGEADDGA